MNDYRLQILLKSRTKCI